MRLWLVTAWLALALAGALSRAEESEEAACRRRVCSGHGTCLPPSSPTPCACDAGFEGGACATRATCYKGCSGNGRCVGDVCRCYPGWHGEDCGTTYGPPPLSVGSMNLTTRVAAGELFRAHPVVVLGVSSPECAKCALAETQYKGADFFEVPFARVDIKSHGLVQMLAGAAGGPGALAPLPALLVVSEHGKRIRPYKGPHAAATLSYFAKHKLSPAQAYKVYEGTDPGEAYDDVLDTNDVVLVACVSSKGDEDALQEVKEAAEELRARHDVHVAILRDFELPFTKGLGLPSVGLFMKRSSSALMEWDDPSSLIAKASLDEDLSIKPLKSGGSMPRQEVVTLAAWTAYWAANSMDYVRVLTPESFARAEALSLPMLMILFPSTGLDDEFRQETELVAKEFAGKLLFFSVDPELYKEKARVLGLEGEALPAMAVNSLGAAYPFRPSAPNVPILRGKTRPTNAKGYVKWFCTQFLAHKLKPFVLDFQAPEAPGEARPHVPGISETFDDAHEIIPTIRSAEEWKSLALNESADVFVFLDDSDPKKCETCGGLAVYFKRACARLADLKEPGAQIQCVRVDARLGFLPLRELRGEYVLPSIFALPANDKGSARTFFSGVAKVFPVMEWMRRNAHFTFEWSEELPQFNREEKVLFKQQIREREGEQAAVDEL